MRIAVLSALAGLALVATGAQAQVTYQLDGLPLSGHEIFNNSQGTETEDCWVANSFAAVAGGTHINSLSWVIGQAYTNQSVTLALYTGTSLTNPSGLSRILASTTNATVTGAADSVATVNLASAIDLPVGQIFYAAMLIRGVPGSFFPFSSDAQAAGAPAPAGRSFFDVGATQGGAYDLDVTTRATLLGSAHPVVSFAQSAGNLALRVNAVPAPAGLGLLGLSGLFAARRRRA